MANTGAPPVIPVEFQQYNSYVVDPQWQRTFSTIWPSVLAFFVIISLPHLLHSIRNGRTPTLGISENLDETYYDILDDQPKSRSPQTLRRSLLRTTRATIQAFTSFLYLTLPGIGLSTGQLLLIAGYAITVILCVVLEAPLVSNSNRAGFLAIAQLPVVFLFATKNSIVSLLLGPGNGYEKLNYIHRWSGRMMFLCALIHGALWIRNHLEFGIEIIGQQKETSGIAAFALLGIIVLTSLKPVRTLCYEVFYVLHLLSFVAFFVTICYHTMYASPWIFAPLALYGFDVLSRMFRHRIKDAILVPVDDQMTLIHIPHATAGWLGGQHIRLRIFFDGRVFESHPLTIFSSTPDISCITSMPPGISLGARVCGDWTRALNNYASQAATELAFSSSEEKSDRNSVEVPVSVMLDGPYGGCSIDLGNYETVLLFAGGSGITFTLGLLDDIVGRCVRKGRKMGERTRRIEFSWCLRSFGTIQWFSSALMDIARVAAASSKSTIPLDLHITIYVTCLCNPETVPPIPNCDVIMVRPSIYRVLMNLTTPPLPNLSSTEKTVSKPALYREASEQTAGDVLAVLPLPGDSNPEIQVVGDPELSIDASTRLPWVGEGGGVAVCASGPATLTRAAANAVARLQLSGRGIAMGGVALHTEVFSL